MRLVIQRVNHAKVTIADEVVGAIQAGLMILVGVAPGDTAGDAAWLAGKASRLRIFEDDDGKMNRSLTDVGGAILAVSQFTLYGDCSKGNRPSFIGAALPEEAEERYNHFVEELRATKLPVETGKFGGEMVVLLENDGPITLILESQGR